MSKLTLDEQKQRQQEYWSKRMEQLEASLHRDAEETVRDLETMYRAAEREIEADLSRWYGRFGANNGVVTMADARKLLTSGELKEFKWTLAEYREKAKDNADGKWQKELENAAGSAEISASTACGSVGGWTDRRYGCSVEKHLPERIRSDSLYHPDRAWNRI